MKCVIHRESFLAAFSQAAAVSPTKGPKEALFNVLLTISGDEVFLVGTDLEQAVRVPVAGVEASKDGSVLLPTLDFGAILRESADEKLTLSLDSKGGLKIAGQRSEYKLGTMSVEEFPPFEDKEPKGFHVAEAQALRTAIQRTLFSCDETNSRYALGGINWAFDGKGLGVATDGRRLAKTEFASRDEDHGKSEGHITPARALKTLVRLLADVEGDVRVSLTSNWSRFETDRFVFLARLLEGRFPQWQTIVQSNAALATKVTLVCGPLSKAIRQAMVACERDGESLGMTFEITDGQLSLSASAGSRESRVEIPIGYEGKGVTVRLNPRFVLDCLKAFPEEATLELGIKDSESAVQFGGEGNYVYVVMPLSSDR
jgi:DNA polymerase-3 subunit beta